MNQLKKFVVITLTLVLLTSCSTLSPAPAAAETRLVQGWVDAYQTLDADKYMSYYAEEAVYQDMALKDFGAFTRDALDRAVHSTFKQEGFKVEISSFFVSSDGKFAAAEGTYYDINKSGKQVAMPMVIILEIRDGKIIRETDYYDRTPMK